MIVLIHHYSFSFPNLLLCKSILIPKDDIEFATIEN